jgi:hypothetical protein
MKKIILFCIAFLSVSHLVFSQKFNDERTRKIVEPILNAVINSEVFDSVYHSNKVCFLINDLIPEDNPWKLSKNGHKVKYITEKQIKKVKQYFVLGDFTLDWNDIENSHVRVMISLEPEDIMLGFGLIFVDKKWIIEGHIIIFPDD